MSPKTVEANLARVIASSVSARVPSSGLGSSRAPGTGPAPGAASTDLATILFTDLVGSTAQTLPSATRPGRPCSTVAEQGAADESFPVLGGGGRHRRRRLVGSLRGPAQAISCALAMREPFGGLGLAARIGVHTGEVERQPGQAAGIAIATCARIMSLADGGEVLVSATDQRSRRRFRIRFEDRGEHELKGKEGAPRLPAAGTSPQT